MILCQTILVGGLDSAIGPLCYRYVSRHYNFE